MSVEDKTALEYHEFPRPGKLEISATKPLATQNDLALAYSPGVAAASNSIVEDPGNAARYTARANLVGVITNGSAVLGLGNIGPLAAKPVMEGKAVLFKKFSGIDVFDIEIDQPDVDKFVDTVAALEPTFGGINLEDIKAPECFEIERRLRERMQIPVFHDDQHGTAIIVTAAVINALKVVDKKIEEVRLVASGAGAAALACLNQLVSAGLRKENIIVTDIVGVVYQGRSELMDQWKSVYAVETRARKLGEVIADADIFLGLSAPGVLKPEMVKKMAPRPLIMALANPTPEITPDLVRSVRDDAVICTGRSDYPNQVNNVLCFPFIFRGALDVGATTINEEMKLACVHALAQLAQKETSDRVLQAYGGEPESFGSDYLIPNPFDPRLIIELAPAVAQAAMHSGVATRPIENMHLYREKLKEFVYRTDFFMRPVFERAIGSGKRVVYAEGESQRVLQAVQQVVDDEIAKPILIGDPAVIDKQITRLGLRIRSGVDIEVLDPHHSPLYEKHWQYYHTLLGREGVTPGGSQYLIKSQPTIVAALMVACGDADSMIAGVIGGFERNMLHVLDIIGTAPGIRSASTLMAHILPTQTIFVCGAHIKIDPSAEEIAEMAIQCAEEVEAFGIKPKVALLSHSSFGSSQADSAEKMRRALSLLREQAPELEAEGEMQADAALSEQVRQRLFPNSRLHGSANLLVMPNIDAANIAVNLLRMLGGGVNVGPILLGTRKSSHVMTQSASVRGLVNMTAIAVGQVLRKELREQSPL